MNILEIPFLENLLNHIKYHFKSKAEISQNELITTNSGAKNFFNFFTINNCKLELKICNSLKYLFTKNESFKHFFQAKNRVIIDLVDDLLYIHGYKTYGEMTYNNLLIYHNWDKNCVLNENSLSKEENIDLKQYCEKVDIKLDIDYPIGALRLLLDILERFDGVELVSVSKNSEKVSKLFKQDSVIDLLSEDDEEDEEYIDLTTNNNDGIIVQCNNLELNEFGGCNKSSDVNIHNNSNLRPIILDGNNIAFGHGCGNFNPIGIQIAINYFLKLGHEIVYALIPRHRQVDGGSIFEKLEKSKNLIYTPSRIVNNIRETSYDDKLILEAALGHDGVVISNDQYRDLFSIPKYKDIIINRLIPYAFVGDLFIIPDDPKGQSGPHLSTILSFNKSAQSEISEPVKSRRPFVKHRRGVNKSLKIKQKLKKITKKKCNKFLNNNNITK